MELKLKTIENLDKRMISTIYNKVKEWDEQIAIAVLPDHPTPVEIRTHVSEPVPFLIWYKGIEPDGVQQFDEQSTVTGAYGLLRLNQFMEEFMKF
jgi:2,3-bisphosphoglycerate-independent phosphoglycerate mutase